MIKTAKNYGDQGYSAYADNWQVAHGGSEPAFTTWTGRRVQHVWMPRTGDHAYLDLDTDMIMPEQEVRYHVYGEGAPAARNSYRFPAPGFFYQLNKSEMDYFRAIKETQTGHSR